MLYRALCSSSSPEFSKYTVFVFFEHNGNHKTAERRLMVLLGNIWGVPADTIQIQNMMDRTELEMVALNDADATHAYLFEIGILNNGIAYTKAPPLFLLRPELQSNLLQGWIALLSGFQNKQDRGNLELHS